jgi:hypothetical protein
MEFEGFPARFERRPWARFACAVAVCGGAGFHHTALPAAR